ncbi:uncharacterized protein EV420DRAFT_1647004 [Desarmillaria tabescens]|uniref:Uncharacterized protein n=1 Tax=Armillaria tabescens TaxID=1929756 RepID=A0AA39MXB5_ARMTA|nr:uncharacterized protein EV420DRAFT_1647004 [Desarmillaria tabescens]KAK0449673.1 hypothetical protein EV420DRAFT_1647004 [Desarmillaria tabescens]
MTNARSFEVLDKVNGAGKDATEFSFYVVGRATALTLHSTMPNAIIRGEWSETALL